MYSVCTIMHYLCDVRLRVFSSRPCIVKQALILLTTALCITARKSPSPASNIFADDQEGSSKARTTSQSVELAGRVLHNAGRMQTTTDHKHYGGDDDIPNAFDWIDASQDLKSWYSKEDYCILLKMKDKDTSFKTLKDCGGSTNPSIRPIPLGYSIMLGDYTKYKPCIPASHPYFKKSMRGFSNPKDVNLVKAFQKIDEDRRCMLFLGDSLTRQTYYAFLAELTRLDGDISLYRYRQGYEVPPGTYPNTFRNDSSVHDSFDDKSGGLSTVYLGPGRTKMTTVWYQHFTNVGGEDLSNAKKVVRMLEETGCNGSVVLANSGLHLINQTLARSEFRQLLAFLEEVGQDKRNLVLWREISAQHFQSSDGSYDPSHSDEYTKCQKIKARPASTGAAHHHQHHHHHDAAGGGVGWRNAVVLDVWKEMKIKQVVYMPFYRATEPLYNMHKEDASNEEDVVDCTHFCHFPMLWQPIWRVLAKEVLNL